MIKTFSIFDFLLQILKKFYINNVTYCYIDNFYEKDFYNTDTNIIHKFCTPNSLERVSLIEYLNFIGINIPHYCYHPDLSIAGSCRMCLVELKKSPKPIVACAMNAKATLSPNSEIFTNSPLVKKARENIMEFLLLNHPLDCPICDQGGECDLQDQSLFFTFTKKRFYNYKRIVTNKNLGPIVKTVMTRCIHCTRCVRFATEIAGVEELGTFGRGIDTEIGTYVDKIFQSELSGNIIDICPVGALTSKPYPFTGRDWELKKVCFIDPSDGFGLNTLIFLKNNIIVKILARHSYTNSDNFSQWITDKTRFLFDSLFSSNRNLNKLIIKNSEQITNITWDDIFKNLVLIIYLFDHLEKHAMGLNEFLIIFDESSSLEVVCLLILLNKKYPFFRLRRSIKIKISNDFESNVQINNITDPNILITSNMCFLIGTNTRYESPYLNLKLKKRFLKGNFQIFTLGSITNLTFPSISIGSNLNKFKTIIEGNSFLTYCIKHSKNLLTVLNIEILFRQDYAVISNMFSVMNKLYANSNQIIYNLLNNSLNSVGISYLNTFEYLSDKDLNSASGVFFINNNLKISTITTKFIESFILNYLPFSNVDKIIIEQNNTNSSLDLINKLNILNYLYLPNNTFFESSGNYINTEGVFKPTVKILSNKEDTKDDWQLLRKLTTMLTSLTLTTKILKNKNISFNSKNIFNFKNFISFFYLTTRSLSKLSFHLRDQNQIFSLMTEQKIKKLKVYLSQLKKWLEDFYIGGSDNHSIHSLTMQNCSAVLRLNTTTFFSA